MNLAHWAAVIFNPGRYESAPDKAGRFFKVTTIRRGFLVFAGYYLGAKLGLALTFQPHPVSVMWPPNSILLAALILSPAREWAFLLLCALPAHLITELHGGVPAGMVWCWFISNSSEALIGAVSTRLILGPTVRFDTVRNLTVLFLCGALLSPFLSSFLDSGFVQLNQWGERDYWEVWRMRFCSNVFTFLMLGTVIVIWGGMRFGSLREMAPRRFIEACLVCLGLLLVNVFIFWRHENVLSAVPALLYAPFPFLLWAAVRFGCAGTSAAILWVALFAIWGAVHGRGPFGFHSPEQNAMAIQVFFVVVSITLMFLAASIEERARAEERFTKAFRSSPDAMVIKRLRDGHIIDVNARCEKMLGYERDELIGRRLLDLNIFASALDRQRFTTETAGQGGWQELEVSLRTKGGDQRQSLISAEADEIGSEECLILIIRDVTERKRAEEAQQNLAHVSRLAVVGELTAMVAHEVNQPLGAILSNADAAELLLESSNPPLDEIRQILADIRKDNLRADEAIRRIRALLRNRAMEIQPVDLKETIRDVLLLVAGDTLRRRVQVRTRLADNLPLALGDRIHLQQVMLNLIVNGMDAMNDTAESARYLTIETKKNQDGSLEVAVKDCGPGITPDKASRMFESFFTTKKEGMGLGLSIARSIIEAHQGRIWAENNPAGGAIFAFTLQSAIDGAPAPQSVNH